MQRDWSPWDRSPWPWVLLAVLLAFWTSPLWT